MRNKELYIAYQACCVHDNYYATVLYKELLMITKAYRDLKKTTGKKEKQICNTLGLALGYPLYKDDQVKFPGTTEEDGVFVGENVGTSLATQAANKIKELNDIINPPSV